MSQGLEATIRVRRTDGFTVDVDFSVAPGNTLAIVGPNGAGKSTVVDAIAGVLPVDSGVVRLDGETLDDASAGVFVPPEHRRVGVVFQDYALFPTMSVAENVAFGIRNTGASKRRSGQVAGEWLDRVGLADLASRRPGELSGGQAQRVALARALAPAPRALLLDEPLAAIDVSSRADLRRVLADHLGQFEGPRVLITHDVTDALLLADGVAVIEEGTLTQVGTTDEIRLAPRTRYVADLAGVNLVEGEARGDEVKVGAHPMKIGDTSFWGPVMLIIRPSAISVHREQPHGSPRNAWATTIDRIEHHGDRVRLSTAGPVPLVAEITPAALEALRLSAGDRIWISIKATEISVQAR